jgi:hypothetical protein
MCGAAVDYFADFGGILPHLSEIVAIYGGILLLFRWRKADSHRPIWRKARRVFVTHLCSLSRPSQSISSIAETHAHLRGAIADTFTPWSASDAVPGKNTTRGTTADYFANFSGIQSPYREIIAITAVYYYFIAVCGGKLFLYHRIWRKPRVYLPHAYVVDHALRSQ